MWPPGAKWRMSLKVERKFFYLLFLLKYFFVSFYIILDARPFVLPLIC